MRATQRKCLTAIPKLDVAGSSPVARSATPLEQRPPLLAAFVDFVLGKVDFSLVEYWQQAAPGLGRLRPSRCAVAPKDNVVGPGIEPLYTGA